MTGNDNQIEFEQSTGNVFADLGFEEPDLELAKAEISYQVGREIKERHLTQTQAAKVLGISQPRVSEVVRGRTEDVSLERLIELLRRLDYAVTIQVSKPAVLPERRLVVTLPS